MTEYEEKTLISSRELLEKTGISRATLNNYIKLGIIPKPIVQKPLADNEKAKQIGYFPQTVLYSIEKVKQMKKEGNSIESIVKTLKGITISGSFLEEERGNVSSLETHVRIPEEVRSTAEKELTLTIDNIQTPAYLINYQFEIEWINEAAEKKIFSKSIKAIRHAESRNIFRLFFSWEFNDYMQNWENMIDFHMAFVKSKFPKDHVEKLYSGISEREVGFLEKVYDSTVSIPTELINQHYITVIKQDGSKEPYKIYSTFFREGIFFLYVPNDSLLEGVDEFLSKRGQVIKDLLKLRLPTLVPFCVLVADLQDSVRICAELPPEEYFKLINQMWKTMEESFKKYYGIYGKHVGDGIVYYFLKERDSNYLTNAIYCAMELKEEMEKLSAHWKVQKKWYNDLFLNIGINEGQEYFNAVHTSTSIGFTALGDTINYAARLSDLARYGSILTTKNLMNKLSEEDRQQFHFGIQRKLQDREVFIENMFSRVVDFVNPEDPKYVKFRDIAALPITEIVK